MHLPFAQIDAFADAAFQGNPAAVIPLPEWFDDGLLLRIAQENNLSETAFLVPDASGESDFELRWFTPAAEVALCGHATLASGHFVLSNGFDRDRVRFRTRRAGLLGVERGTDGYRMALPAWAPEPQPIDDVVAALGVTPVETLFHDKGYPVVVVADEAAVLAANPDLRALKACGPMVAVVTARGRSADVVSRVFCPVFDIDEDPVTGSAHAVIAPYWAAKLGRDRFTAFQASARGGRMSCEVAGAGDEPRVFLTGGCVTVIEGLFLLP